MTARIAWNQRNTRGHRPYVSKMEWTGSRKVQRMAKV